MVFMDNLKEIRRSFRGSRSKIEIGFDKHKLKAVTTNEKNPLPTKETIEQEKSSSP